MKTNVLVGWCKEVYGVAVEKFPDRPFTFKELRTAIEWEEYHPEVKSFDAVLLANLQTLRNRELMTFVSRGVYQLVGTTSPSAIDIKDKVIAEGQVHTTITLTEAQRKLLNRLRDGYDLIFRSNHGYSIKDGIHTEPANFMVARSLVTKGFVRKISEDIVSTIYSI